MSISTSIKRYPVTTYYALVFAISWGCIFMVIGADGFLGTEPISETQFISLILLAPLLGPGVAGLLSTVFLYGRAGLRGLLSRLFRWQVSVRWYAVALVTAPLLVTTILFALSVTPAIITASDKASLLLSSIAVGLFVSFFEELGWTGFVIPQLRKRYGILTTGLIVGLLWGAWHFPLFSGSAGNSGVVPSPLFLAVLLFSWLPPYRVLMVWVYDHTKSLLVGVLMHAAIDFCSLAILPSAMSGLSSVTYDLVFAAVLWVVAGIAVIKENRGKVRSTTIDAQVIAQIESQSNQHR